MPGLVVRPVAARDEKRWRELFQGYVTFYEATVAESVVALTWRRLLAGEDGMAGLVAVDKTDRPIGLANLVFHRSTWSETCYCYLEDLFADPSVRGTGVGRALINATYAEADIIVESLDVQHAHMVNAVLEALANWNPKDTT